VAMTAMTTTTMTTTMTMPIGWGLLLHGSKAP
jgi:hypothetical protein